AGRLAQVEGEISVLSADVSAYENGQLSGDTAVSIDALSDDVEAKQRILEDLVIALEKTKKENGVSEKIANLDLEAKKAEIEKQKAKVEKLKKNCETTEIKSKYSGVVTAINIKPGEMTVPDTPLAVIDISAEGYKVRVSVDGEKANQVKEGVSAEVVNNWGGDVTAVLCDIKNDTVSGSDNRILEFDVTGNVDSGTYLDLSIPLSSGEYQVIVPKSAVYEDKNGKFVLIVKSKSSPLGNRYFAERISVDVIVSDETSCAVSAGELNAGDYVITAASKPVSPGDQVRMKD
ncbi:MAG: HlyD family efflux transporter periplasmic adaptor subunit, partial [Ruminococcus sp.]|nr:HlyD family efflux transporter periplasmic adaptor subunit [Ruminococcus sp.]